MEENKLMDVINEEGVNEICEEVVTKRVSLVKLGIAGVAIAGVGYGVYKLVKHIKARKNNNETEVEESEKDVKNDKRK